VWGEVSFPKKSLQKFTIYAKYTYMNDTADPIILILFLVGVVAVIVIQVAIIRWLFRINEIVALLKDILSAIRPQNLIPKKTRRKLGTVTYFCF
jgi:hypothetical protein